MPGKPPPKADIITFKADKALLAALEGVTNRSAFIRNAVLAALDHVCPLCKGSGMMTPQQRRHWDAFARDHTVEVCHDCHAPHLVCEGGPGGNAHADGQA